MEILLPLCGGREKKESFPAGGESHGLEHRQTGSQAGDARTEAEEETALL